MQARDPEDVGGPATEAPESERPAVRRARSPIRAAARVLLAAAIGMGGAWLGVLTAGGQMVQLGPCHVRLAARFGAGKTIVALPPVGQLAADTHTAPLTIRATLESVNVPQLVDRLQASGADAVAADTERAVRHTVRGFALRLFLVAVGAALTLAALVYRRRWRRILVAVLAAALVTGASEVGTALTYRTQAFRTPTYSGTIALAPQLVGPAKEVLGRIDDFRAQLVGVVNAAGRVYTTVGSSVLPERDQIRVLHISDIHLSPLGMSYALELARTFDVDLVIDTGDLTSYGSLGENVIVSSIANFHRPYVFVRGNHDSPTTEAAVRAIPNAVVLDGQVRRVRGLLIYGLGDPVFTPNVAAAVDDATMGREVAVAAPRVLADVARLRRVPDIVAVHDDRMAGSVAGVVPLVISGHFHAASERNVNGTIYLRDGSTGGAGVHVFSRVGGIPLAAEILTFSRTTPPRLVAYDVVLQSPETGSLTITRHIVTAETPGGTVSPTPTPSPVSPSRSS